MSVSLLLIPPIQQATTSATSFYCNMHCLHSPRKEGQNVYGLKTPNFVLFFVSVSVCVKEGGIYIERDSHYGSVAALELTMQTRLAFNSVSSNMC